MKDTCICYTNEMDKMALECLLTKSICLEEVSNYKKLVQVQDSIIQASIDAENDLLERLYKVKRRNKVMIVLGAVFGKMMFFLGFYLNK